MNRLIMVMSSLIICVVYPVEAKASYFGISTPKSLAAVYAAVSSLSALASAAYTTKSSATEETIRLPSSQQQNFSWKSVDYADASNYTLVSNDVLTFLNILFGPTTNSSHVAAFYSPNECASESSSFLVSTFYVPELNFSPSETTLSEQWALFDTGQQPTNQVSSVIASFLNSNLTLAQAFYSKIGYSQACNSGCDNQFDDTFTGSLARGYVWYPLPTSQQTAHSIRSAGDASQWHVRYFTGPSSENIATSFAQVLGILPMPGSFCSQFALGAYYPGVATDSGSCGNSEGYGAAMIPANLNTIPDGSTLDGTWNVQNFNGIPKSGFAQLQQFISNLTDAQLCYSRIGLIVHDNTLNNSVVSLWYQNLASETKR